MFDLAPDKILIILLAVFIFLGPKELPVAARRISSALRQLRDLQATLRSEVGSLIDTENVQPSIEAPTETLSEPDPNTGDSFT
jgi:Sec-independent protein translocase protein TatA